ncbi:MAG: alpha/beta fold hydrolase [Chloroflexota bacterium]
MELFDLGDFPLLSGYTLPGAKLSYTTLGTLSPAKDNAILFPHFLGGAPEALTGWINTSFPLDPSKYFFILPGQFGNGVSTSPSNSAPPFDKGAFPPCTFADDVIAQHKLVTEQFGIQELQLVLGWSTGGLQTYEWAVRYASMVKRVAAIATAPKPSPWTRLWLLTLIEEPHTSDPAYNRGFYASQDAMHAGLRRQAHGTALTLPPHNFYRDELWRNLGFSSLEDFISRFWEAFWLPQDPNDLIVQARKARAADPAHGGDLSEALATVTAKTAVIAFTGDPMFPPEEGKVDASQIKGASFTQIDSIYGHLATFQLSQDDVAAVNKVLAKLLAS